MPCLASSGTQSESYALRILKECLIHVCCVPPFPALLSCPVQSASYRGLVSLGVGAIGEAPVSGCSSSDASRLGVIVTGMRGGVLMTEELLANGLPIDGISGSLVAGVPSSNPLAVPADPVSDERHTQLLKTYCSNTGFLWWLVLGWVL